jgi:hypothetical protein
MPSDAAMTDLKLLALDSEDLEVISATTQDAVVRVPDMGYAGGDRRFALLMNRYAWETGGGGRGRGERRRAALSFARVTGVTSAGINLEAHEGVLELLDLRFEPAELPAGTVELRFAGGGTIRLAVECIEARLEDLGAAWAATARPEHQL